MKFWTVMHNHHEYASRIFSSKEDAHESCYPTILEEFGEQQVMDVAEDYKEFSPRNCMDYFDTDMTIHAIDIDVVDKHVLDLAFEEERSNEAN